MEMYELWDSIEKLNFTQKEVTIDYVPVRREDSYIKIPTVKSVAGTGLEVVSSSEKSIYREIAEDAKKESLSKRDEY